MLTAPYHETLLGFAALQEVDRIDGLVDHARAVQSAMRMNAAFADPKRLEQEQREVLATLRQSPTRDESFTKADALDMVARVLQQIEGKPETEVTTWPSS